MTASAQPHLDTLLVDMIKQGTKRSSQLLFSSEQIKSIFRNSTGAIYPGQKDHTEFRLTTTPTTDVSITLNSQLPTHDRVPNFGGHDVGMANNETSYAFKLFSRNENVSRLRAKHSPRYERTISCHHRLLGGRRHQCLHVRQTTKRRFFLHVFTETQKKQRKMISRSLLKTI